MSTHWSFQGELILVTPVGAIEEAHLLFETQQIEKDYYYFLRRDFLTTFDKIGGQR